jgi:hypothetical protein
MSDVTKGQAMVAWKESEFKLGRDRQIDESRASCTKVQGTLELLRQGEISNRLEIYLRSNKRPAQEKWYEA